MKSTNLRISLFQINTTVGDIKGNAALVASGIAKAKKLGADLAIFPELAITGYPPEDLLLRQRFVDDNIDALDGLASLTEGITVVAGYVDRRNSAISNATAVFHDGQRSCAYYKICLPNYGVFDEKRYFVPGTEILVIDRQGTKIGISICEDVWIPDGVVETLAYKAGAEVVVNISCSPFHAHKGQERAEMMIERARNCRVFLAYCNLIGGQDELVFDGQSLIIGPSGQIVSKGRAFEEDVLTLDLDIEKVRSARSSDEQFRHRQEQFRAPYSTREVMLPRVTSGSAKPGIATPSIEELSPEEEICRALILGTRDYVRKNGFVKVVLGLSGGIDSALVAWVAAEALGPENVVGVAMPSQYSSETSLTDARELVEILGIEFRVINIQPAFEAYKEMLADSFIGLEEDVTEENVQARIRGNLLMALANKFGWLVLATGNKSEVGVGYCTIYGDMVGGFSVLKDVPKTMVYRLARHINQKRKREIIPKSIIEKPPSAELKPDQKDEDSLPPYSVLDPILEAYVEKDMGVRGIAELGYDEKTIREVTRLVESNEYKRRQGAPGIKITPRAFGKDRRMPITNRYIEE